MLERMDDEPHVRQHNFSQMDYYNYCQCDECRAVNERYGTPGGTQFQFVNQLAERTAVLYPDKLIGTLAYMYTEEPPIDLEVHSNVAVWLCHMYPSCDSHPIDSCPHDAEYRRRAMAWSELTSHLYIWHYITDFTHYYAPFPNFRAMASDIRLYRDLGVEGIYLQGMGHDGGGGEFSLMRPYYGMRLLWNPDEDPDAILQDFLDGYYGHAGQPIWEYVQLLHDKVEDEDIHMHLYTNPAQGYLPDEIVDEAETLFDRAEAAVADDEELLDRVQVARMPLFYARFFPRNGYEIRDGVLEWNGERPPISGLNEFLGRMESHGFEMVREASGDTSTMMLLYYLVTSPHPVTTIENDHLQIDMVPNLAGRVLRIIDRATGECVTAHDVRRGLFYPFSGGLEDRVGGIFRFYGWVEPAFPDARSDLSLTLSLQTLDGFELRRTVTLRPDEPIISIRSTVTNTDEDPREARLHNHLELDLGDVRGSRDARTFSNARRRGDRSGHDQRHRSAPRRRALLRPASARGRVDLLRDEGPRGHPTLRQRPDRLHLDLLLPGDAGRGRDRALGAPNRARSRRERDHRTGNRDPARTLRFQQVRPNPGCLFS